MNIWETTLRSIDVVNYSSSNKYIELLLTSSKRVTMEGKKEVKIDCAARLFKINNGVKMYSPQEQYSSKIYSIKEGKLIKSNIDFNAINRCRISFIMIIVILLISSMSEILELFFFS